MASAKAYKPHKLPNHRKRSRVNPALPTTAMVMTSLRTLKLTIVMPMTMMMETTNITVCCHASSSRYYQSSG